MKLFNTRIEYGIKALTLLAARATEMPVTAGYISTQLNIPKEYTSKVLQTLARNRILTSRRGKNGGFRMIKNPEDILLTEIIDSLDIKIERDKCFFGFDKSDICSNCFAHEEWDNFFSLISASLSAHTLGDIIRIHK